MSDDGEVLVLEPASTELTLGRLGRVVVREPSMAAEHFLDVEEQSAQAPQARSNALLAACLDPEVDDGDVARLSDRDRRRLMLAVIRLKDGEKEWRALYGTDLSLDERFVSAMRTIRDREMRSMLASLRKSIRRNVVLPNEVAANYAKQMQNAIRASRHLSGISGHFAMLDKANQVMKTLATAATPPVIAPLKHLTAPANLDVLGGKFAMDGSLGLIGKLDRSVFIVPRSLSLIEKVQMAPLLTQGWRAAYTAALPKVVSPNLVGGSLAQLLETQQQFAEVAAFIEQWQEHPLWFLVKAFGMRASRVFAGLTLDEAEELLLDALEQVVRDGEFVPALRRLLDDAPLNDLQREWLGDSLDHAARGLWAKALPPFFFGFEGALYNVAVAQQVVKQNEGKILVAEGLLRKLSFSADFTLFLIRRVYGGTGHAFRHGRADSGERQQMLYGVVAVAGWADVTLGTSALRVLASRLGPRLSAAVEGSLAPALPSGATEA
jgi:hypothetical protein